MTFKNRLAYGLLATLVLLVPTVLLGQPPAPQATEEVTKELSSGKPAAAATIDAIMEQAVRNITARYNLNDKQSEITRKLMKTEVYRFLSEHEDTVWPAIRDLLATQIGINPPDDHNEIKRIGAAARPLAKLAREAIFEANERWRDILTDEQKKMHDFDLGEMNKTFDTIDGNFETWEKGEPHAGGIFPPPNLVGQPARPGRPPAVLSERVTYNPERVFATLVEEFIKEYGLDEGQITAARSILAEYKFKAKAFAASKKRELAQIGADQQVAHDNADLSGIRKAHAAQKELLRPVMRLSVEMGDRLHALLTTAQIQRHADSREAEKSPTRARGDDDDAEGGKKPPPRPKGSGSRN